MVGAEVAVPPGDPSMVKPPVGGARGPRNAAGGKQNGMDKTKEKPAQAHRGLQDSGMEITVVQASDVPSKPVLALRAGLARRQAKLELEKPFEVACPDHPNATVEVTLFQQLASQVLPSEPEALCSVPVRRPDGAASQVKLRVRRKGSVTNAAPQEASAAAKDYLEQHQLQQRIQDMIQEVLHAQPRDPYRFMLEQLRKERGLDAAVATQQVPVPVLEGIGDCKSASFGEVPATPNKERVSEDVVRSSLFAVFNSPPCMEVAKASIQEAVRKEAAKSITASVLGAYMRGTSVVDGGADQASPFLAEATVREQAAAVIRTSLYNIAPLLVSQSPSQKRGVVRFSIVSAMEGATEILGRDPDARRTSLVEGAYPEEPGYTLPTPIVNLGGHRNSWGAWMSPSDGGSSPTAYPRSPCRTEDVPCARAGARRRSC